MQDDQKRNQEQERCPGNHLTLDPGYYCLVCGWQQPPAFSCVNGCYTLQYANDLESGGPGWYPLQWLDGAWRAYFSVGFFELVTLRFPTYAEALTFIGEQP